MKVYMTPQPNSFRREESGIRRVVEYYARYGPKFGIEYVDRLEDADLVANHVQPPDGLNIPPDMPMVAHCHGLYWTADYQEDSWQLKANMGVITALRRANAITVPSAWVAETIARDMRVMPHILPHGIDWQAWQHDEPPGDYAIWNKNRAGDVCSPEPVNRLAREFPKMLFWSTFIETNPTENIKFMNFSTESRPRIVPHDQMRELIQRCAVYLATTKETFGIGTLEAMAAGKPVLGWNFGGNVDLVEHGVNGYLATPGNWDDLFEGMRFCVNNAVQLGNNSRELAKKWMWETAVEQVAEIYKSVLNPEPSTVGVVITRYQQEPEIVKRAIDSVMAQTRQPDTVVVVNDGGDDCEQIEAHCHGLDILFVNKPNGGVASARNAGIEKLNATYIQCLDADDWDAPNYLEVTAAALDANPLVGIAYTGLTQHNADGTSELSHWPPQQDYNRQCDYERRYNQALSGSLFRREAWQRVGGYRSRYCPTGAGSEDAAFWTAIGSIGYEAVKVTDEGLFNYSTGGHTSQKGYLPPDWLAWYPWSRDKMHPFASIASPPNTWSHPVRQYDEPIISVIIPVGPGHGKYVIDALDSLEAQHFRRWEVIVVDDTGDSFDVWRDKITVAFPYVKWMTCGGWGAGYARNVGARRARGRFLFFLDADDYLNEKEPTSFDAMLRAWSETEAAVYTDYLGVSFIDDPDKLAADLQPDILSRNPKTGETVIRHRASPYDCAKAVKQPEPGTDAAHLYLWCNISTLIPRSWHFEIGGFDKEMETWEDIDYWYRLARAGKCFTRLEIPSLVYRFHTGRRRQFSHAKNADNRHNWQDVVKYMVGKYKETEPMACGGCGSAKKTAQPTPVQVANMAADFADENFIMARYISPNIGAHQVNGMPHFDFPPPMANGRRSGKYYIKYGRLPGGGKRQFRVHAKDVEAMPHLFQVVTGTPVVELPPVSRPAPTPPQPVQLQPAPLPAPEPPTPQPKQLDGFNLELLPISPQNREAFTKARLTTPGLIQAVGIDGIKALDVDHTRAEFVMQTVEGMLEAEVPPDIPVYELKGMTARALKSLQEYDIETASELVATFGDSGRNTDDKAIAELTKLKGIGKVTAAKIWKAANEA